MASIRRPAKPSSTPSYFISPSTPTSTSTTSHTVHRETFSFHSTLPMDYNSADLTSVLRTLSALSNQQHHHQPLQQPSPPAPAPLQKTTTTQSHKLEQGAPAAPAAPSPAEEDDPYEPSESLPHIPVAPTPALAPTAPSTPSQTRSHPNAATEDTSTITTWPTALRYVMRTVAQNESIQQRIRWLMQRQYDHEKQWWQGREALLRKQASRIEKKKELDAVL